MLRARALEEPPGGAVRPPQGPAVACFPRRRTTHACLPFQGGEQAWLRSGGAAASQLLLRRGELSLPITPPASRGGTGQRTQSLTPVSTALFPSESQPHRTCLTGPQTCPRHTPTDNPGAGGWVAEQRGPGFLCVCRLCGSRQATCRVCVWRSLEVLAVFPVLWLPAAAQRHPVWTEPPALRLSMPGAGTLMGGEAGRGGGVG